LVFLRFFSEPIYLFDIHVCIDPAHGPWYQQNFLTNTFLHMAGVKLISTAKECDGGYGNPDCKIGMDETDEFGSAGMAMLLR
jgi:hypothetical protein